MFFITELHSVLLMLRSNWSFWDTFVYLRPCWVYSHYTWEVWLSLVKFETFFILCAFKACKVLNYIILQDIQMEFETSLGLICSGTGRTCYIHNISNEYDQPTLNIPLGHSNNSNSFLPVAFTFLWRVQSALHRDTVKNWVGFPVMSIWVLHI